MLFDTHAHYDDRAFDADREAVLDGLSRAGIGAVMNAASNMESSFGGLTLARRYPWIICGAGIHPMNCRELNDETQEKLFTLCHSNPEKIRAFGEIGLDYSRPDPPKKMQREAFARQLSLAARLSLPVIIHSRDAAKDTLDILTEEKKNLAGGIIHCFSYSKEMARSFMDLGFYLGIGGTLTFKNARKVKEAVCYAPLGRLCLETDSPYLAPHPFRGKRNSSALLYLVAEALAALKGVSREEVCRVTWDNAVSLYRMDFTFTGRKEDG